MHATFIGRNLVITRFDMGLFAQVTVKTVPTQLQTVKVKEIQVRTVQVRQAILLISQLRTSPTFPPKYHPLSGQTGSRFSA